MNDLVSYIFRNMDATDKHLVRIYKALVHQNKFNKATTLFSVVTTLNLFAILAANKKMHQEIVALRKEMDEFKELEGV